MLGELLVRRMKRHGDDIDAAIADAELYLDNDSGRSIEVRQFAAYLTIEHQGCAAALGWLNDLHAAGSTEDSVVLAECLAPTDPDRARDLLHHALPSLDGVWSTRATRLLAVLGEDR